MGITARGAWEAVKRHFREIDIDIQTTPFTVAGVGDMSGDVFGNGMLLSPAIKLVAAFDHRDIFLDPDPDPARTLTERQRLFDLPRSSWVDYDKSLISPGGGVFSRQAKSIPLSPVMQTLLDLTKAEVTPPELMTAILKARVDLLWFGGIGTYIRATDESDAQVGDRANDAIRITGGDVRARAIGEGANLGATQRGRIEAARKGVKLNTDAIDNSAGVNTSDVEVNIKIALAGPVKDGRLAEDDRNALLAEMTDEVGLLVLRNNYLQTLALSLTEAQGQAATPGLRRLMQALEAEGRLDRSVEYLPSDATIAEREKRGEGLTRPELSVLLAYAKLALHDALLASPVPDDLYLNSELVRYFPKALRDGYAPEIAGHKLRREIVATQLANAIVNRGGPAIVTTLADQTRAEAPAIAAAYAIARDSFDLIALNASIDALDAKVPGKTQLGLYAAAQELVSDRMSWFLRRGVAKPGAIEQTVARYARGVSALAAELEPTAGGRRPSPYRPDRGADVGRRARGARRPDRQPAGARPGDRHRRYRGAHRTRHYRGGADSFRSRFGLRPVRSGGRRRCRARDGRLRTSRPRARRRDPGRCPCRLDPGDRGRGQRRRHPRRLARHARRGRRTHPQHGLGHCHVGPLPAKADGRGRHARRPAQQAQLNETPHDRDRTGTDRDPHRPEAA